MGKSTNHQSTIPGGDQDDQQHDEDENHAADEEDRLPGNGVVNAVAAEGAPCRRVIDGFAA